MSAGETVTLSTPAPTHDGFGCPGCGAPLDLRDRKSIARGSLACCGYMPDVVETARWTAAARALKERT